jgi:ribosomal protein S18 acetylase RimI-like enzyme
MTDNRQTTPAFEIAPAGIEIRPMTLLDIHAAIAIWKDSPGIVLRDDDSQAGIERYLTRNPKLSFVAAQSLEIIGAVLCGHDGRRGYLQHVAVLPKFQNRGIGSALVDQVLLGLEQQGIQKAHVDVLTANTAGHLFWANYGWTKRTDIARYSLALNGATPWNRYRFPLTRPER